MFSIQIGIGLKEYFKILLIINEDIILLQWTDIIESVIGVGRKNVRHHYEESLWIVSVSPRNCRSKVRYRGRLTNVPFALCNAGYSRVLARKYLVSPVTSYVPPTIISTAAKPFDVFVARS